MNAKFIVFEGIDGSGTSTQSSMLKEYLLNQNNSAFLTCEPSDGPIGNLIRQAFKGRIQLAKGKNTFQNNADLFDEQMAYLFAADRHDHLYNKTDGVFKLIAGGASVISTRYFFSSLAYHSSTNEDYEFVATLNNQFPDPDIVIYLDNPVEVSMMRMSNRAFKDEYENEKKLRKVKSFYDKAFSTYKGNLLRIDATLSPEEIHKKIVKGITCL